MKSLKIILLGILLGLSSAAVAQDSLNINTASAEMLAETIEGVGERKAEAIVRYREEHGPFASVDELLEVRGIGPKTLERSRDKLSVGP